LPVGLQIVPRNLTSLFPARVLFEIRSPQSSGAALHRPERRPPAPFGTAQCRGDRWPACFEDVQAALRWVKTNASTYKGDPQRLALIGYSAGGNLAFLAVVLASPDTGLQAVVGLAPVTDHEQDLPQRGGLSPSLQDLHNRPKEVTPESLALLRATSPINHVKPGLPPFLLIHGDADRSVPYQQSLNFQQKLHACGVPCDIIRLPGAPHAIQTWEMIDPHYAHKMVEWLQRTLRADGGACPPSVVKAGAP
jgi:acetyl esterase/lipase